MPHTKDKALILSSELTPPRLILFDWHGTLVDTLGAMYATMEEMLPQFEDLGLVARLTPETECKNDADAKLVRYIRIFRQFTQRFWPNVENPARKYSTPFLQPIMMPEPSHIKPTMPVIETTMVM